LNQSSGDSIRAGEESFIKSYNYYLYKMQTAKRQAEACLFHE
jgi:hypothetical protein